MGIIHFSTKGKFWPQHLRVLVAGDPGTGKTTFATDFPDPFVINCAGGLASVADQEFAYADVYSEADVATAVEAIKAGSDGPLGDYTPQTLVIDSIDELQRRIMLSRLNEKQRSETQIDDWGWIATRFNKMFTALANLDMHLVITCRINDEMDKLAIGGQFGNQIHNYVDYALRAETPLKDLPEGADELLATYRLTNDDSWTHALTGTDPILQSFEALSLTHEQKGAIMTASSEEEGVEIEGAETDLDIIFNNGDQK